MGRPPTEQQAYAGHSSEQFALRDLIPLEELQQFQDILAEIHHVFSVITDPDGNPLTMPSNEMSSCKLVRRSSKGDLRCQQNYQHVADQIRQEQQLVCRPCRTLGFLHAAVPIFVKRIHVANWWIRQPCVQTGMALEIDALAADLDVDPQRLKAEFENLPPCSRERFEKVLTWIDSLAHRITKLGYQNLILSRDVSKLHNVEGELHKYKSQLEGLVQERTADLLQANKRLQSSDSRRNLKCDAIICLLQTVLMSLLSSASLCTTMSSSLLTETMAFSSA